jgi:Family of unknown function (DUF6500)
MRCQDRPERPHRWAFLLRILRQQNDDPVLLMEAATWWISTHQLDHFEKATKIRAMVEMLEN